VVSVWYRSDAATAAVAAGNVHVAGRHMPGVCWELQPAWTPQLEHTMKLATLAHLDLHVFPLELQCLARRTRLWVCAEPGRAPSLRQASSAYMFTKCRQSAHICHRMLGVWKKNPFTAASTIISQVWGDALGDHSCKPMRETAVIPWRGNAWMRVWMCMNQQLTLPVEGGSAHQYRASPRIAYWASHRCDGHYTCCMQHWQVTPCACYSCTQTTCAGVLLYGS
jgi:hypothetical protein